MVIIFFRNDFTKLNRKSKAEYNNKLIEQLNSSVISGKQWFKVANKFRKQQSIHTIPTLIDGESEASTNEDKATLLNSYFCSQSSIDDSNHHLPNIPTTDCSISQIDISVQDVKDAINLIDAYKASGPDRISPKLAKYSPLSCG